MEGHLESHLPLTLRSELGVEDLWIPEVRSGICGSIVLRLAMPYDVQNLQPGALHG